MARESNGQLMITLPDFLTEEQIKKAIELYKAAPEGKRAQAIHDDLLNPQWDEIDNKLAAISGEAGNHPMYFAYACEYAISQGIAKGAIR